MPAFKGHTDPITNRVVLKQFRLELLIDRLLQGSLPLNCLPEMLHERAHYDLGLSRVGVALAALSLRISRAWTRQRYTSQVIDDLRRYLWVRSFLRPLGEGLALFAEHDVYPGESRVQSTVLNPVFPLFARGTLRSAPSKQEWERRIKMALFQTRTAPFAISAKADLLESSLASGDGYLSGYWALKRLHFDARHLCDQMYDADLFYAFSMEWIFSDAALALAIVSPPACDGGASHEMVADVMQRRLHVMFDGDFLGRVSEFENFALKQSLADEWNGDIGNKDRSFCSFSGWTPKRREVFASALGEIIGGPGDVTFEVWNNRSAFRLGHFDASVAVERGQFEVQISSATLMKGAALPVSNGIGTGRIEAFLGPNALTCFLTVRRADELIAVIDGYGKTLNQEATVEIARRVPNSREMELLQLAFELLSPISKSLSNLGKEAAEKVSTGFIMVALQETDVAGAAQSVANLQGAGILKVFGEDRTLLRTLSAVSLLNTCRIIDVEKLSTELGITTQDLLERLTEINRCSVNVLSTHLVWGLPESAITTV